MARSLRIEYAGAIYHVLNRGNYRQPIFATDGNKEVFLAALWSACQRYRWAIHAYCLMDNHYHLAIGTEQPNLSVGMHWESLLEKMLSFHGKGKGDIGSEKKSAAWKVMIAYHLERRGAVSNGWLSSHLGMGSCAGVSRYVSEFEQAGGPKGRVYERMIAKTKT